GQMCNLGKNLIVLSRRESPQLLSQKSSVDFAELVRSTTDEFEERFAAANIDLRIDELQPAIVVRQPDELRMLVGNLLENALRYSEPGGSVIISLISLARGIKLSVADTGIGIPPESLKKIFDRFYRVDQSRSRAAGGSGL